MIQFARPLSLLLLLLLCLTSLTQVEAVVQSLVLDISIRNSAGHVIRSTSFLAAQAFYGEHPRMDPSNLEYATIVDNSKSNLNDPFLCSDKVQANSLPANSALLIPRGICTFEKKSLNAQKMGARLALIHGALKGRYSLNETRNVNNDTNYQYHYDDIIFPQEKYDYDCNYGQAYIAAERLSFQPLPYNPTSNDHLLSGPSSDCVQKMKGDSECPSQACLLTGSKDSSGRYQACCAWDLPIWLYSDTSINDDQVHIPSAYLTMAQARELKSHMSNTVAVRLYARWRPEWNMSSMLIWALGVTVAALAAYLTATDYRERIAKTLRDRHGGARDSGPSQASETSQQQQQRPIMEESLELTPAHALGFVVMASSSLFILFYFKIYNVVKVFYAFVRIQNSLSGRLRRRSVSHLNSHSQGCSNALAQVALAPLLMRGMHKMNISNPIVIRTGTEDFGDFTLCDVASTAMGYMLGAIWLFIAFTVRNPDTVLFFWFMQDVFGACMCILFLKIIRLNSIHVASALLVVAFFYDIFFVFITPLIFKKSIMLTVATSGGPPKADALWCEKYPDDQDCQGGNPLPMLLTIPRLMDYAGGSSMLGLGDIVLPGLLLSFGCRYDAAKSLVGIMGGGSGALNGPCPEQEYSVCRLCTSGYYIPLVVAYAVGLFMANAAVYLMNYGQPALLYLVPCCLGTICFIGWRRGELLELWHGPRALKAADILIYGEVAQEDGNTRGPHTPLPPDDDGVQGNAPPSAIDDNNDSGDGVALQERFNRPS